ncbi:MAG: lipid-A-disaccharide synthase [Planctomycetota bacterium]|jgi:lipid-A-disaccharide synthase
MSEDDKTYRIFLSAAEPSADTHCASLITALKQSAFNIEFVGVGGPKMAEAGCKLLQNTVAKAAMTYQAFSRILHFYKLIRRITLYLNANKTDLVIVCDSPAFNFHIAKAAKKAGAKTLFYVAPQLWAWAPWRIKKLKKYCDKLCCILPFEQDWFTQREIDAVFVGNPMLDDLDADLTGRKKIYENFEPKNAKLALMPGSRTGEINSLWQPMQKIAAGLKRKYPNITIIAVAVDEAAREAMRSMQIIGFRCSYAIDSVAETACDADFSLVASGSATLQVAAAGCPMVIMYQSSPILWHLLGQWLVKMKHLSLVNILADKELVPEFMPYFTSTDPIVQKCQQLLADSDKLAQTSDQLIRLVASLQTQTSAKKTAQIALQMLT